MYSEIKKQKNNAYLLVDNSASKQNSNVKQSLRFVDNRTESIAQERMQTDAIKTSKIKQLHAQSHRENNVGIIQLIKWKWVEGTKWVNDDGVLGGGPRRPGAHDGEIVEYDEPAPLLSLNLGAGQNPMVKFGSINLEYSKDDAEKGKANYSDAEYILADATKPLPFRTGVFDEIHAINPYGFNPVSTETSRVMASTGILHVTGNNANKYAKNSGAAHEKPEKAGLYQSGISEISAAHKFGKQSHSGGGTELDISSSQTRSYVKGNKITLSEAAHSSNAELKRYYDLYTKLELEKITEREEGYQDDYSGDDEYLDRDECIELSEFRKKFGNLVL
ncbi:hypothetical protein [Kluyvera ascorbata]|uniref:hypothetical protein n=1 Tax=Kluyvera ascorbata TaxID=51288 RepID=UPI0028DE2C30|nr:hypothetical protein [Kluyvera ascorbata]MDT8700928.1 hypothetical protein [Kluyvera ascorbata]